MLGLKFDVVTGEMLRVSIECKIGISVKCRVLVQASKLIKSSSAVYKNLFVKLKMYSKQGHIKKLSSKAKSVKNVFQWCEL